MAQVLSIPLDEEAWDARAAQADSTVAEATTDIMFPFPRQAVCAVPKIKIGSLDKIGHFSFKFQFRYTFFAVAIILHLEESLFQVPLCFFLCLCLSTPSTTRLRTLQHGT